MCLKKILLLLLLITQVKAQTYYKDVAGIFYNRCGSCHNMYSHAASLLSYSEVSSQLPAIQSYLNSGKMPLWAPDTNYTRFRHEQHITQNEKAAILNWISNGAQAGDTTQAPLAPVFSRNKLYGVADLELKIPNFSSNASSSDSHNCFVLPTGLSQDRIIRAFEVVVGNAEIVHHVSVSIDSGGTKVSDLSGSCYFGPGDYIIGGYTPGSIPSVFPSQGPLRSGIKLKGGANLVLNIHYAAGTAGETDSTRLRVYLYPPGATGVRPVKMLFVKNNSFSLPANAVTTISAQFPPSGALTNALSLLAVYPHSHKVCTKVLNYAASQTDTIPLIAIPKWDADWQGWYTYRKLIKITAGHQLIAQHTFDNTSNNPNNPFSPPQVVNSGSTINDEMLVDTYQYLDHLSGDENIDLDSLLNADPIFDPSVGITGFSAINMHTWAFPNPFAQSTRLYYELRSSSSVKIEVFNSNGVYLQTLQNKIESAGQHSISWSGNNEDGSAQPAGIYFYVIITSHDVFTGKLFLTNTGE